MPEKTIECAPCKVSADLDAYRFARLYPGGPAATGERRHLIEGEVEVSIGSGGFHEVFGTAVAPVGEDGVAIISLGSAESRRHTRRRR